MAIQNKKIILFIDDDEDDFLILRGIFKEFSSDIELQWVRDGEEAINYLTQQGNFKDAEKPLLILLDLNMPKLNGEEVLRQIRNHESLRYIPVVVLSNSMNKKDVMTAYELGGNSFIRKPAGYKELREMAQTLSKYWFEHSTLI